ncbi:hypothetical protein Ciccas_005636 [Cichlidogyrus casuarinus]|uniref:Uncharacterized protein n=1 Tax=Cichlidogyrus casuarinus TaxID=1844966 RepID=A0ABD2QBQ8_9PLAT
MKLLPSINEFYDELARTHGPHYETLRDSPSKDIRDIIYYGFPTPKQMGYHPSLCQFHTNSSLNNVMFYADFPTIKDFKRWTIPCLPLLLTDMAFQKIFTPFHEWKFRYPYSEQDKKQLQHDFVKLFRVYIYDRWQYDKCKSSETRVQKNPPVVTMKETHISRMSDVCAIKKLGKDFHPFYMTGKDRINFYGIQFALTDSYMDKTPFQDEEVPIFPLESNTANPDVMQFCVEKFDEYYCIKRIKDDKYMLNKSLSSREVSRKFTLLITLINPNILVEGMKIAFKTKNNDKFSDEIELKHTCMNAMEFIYPGSFNGFLLRPPSGLTSLKDLRSLRVKAKLASLEQSLMVDLKIINLLENETFYCKSDFLPALHVDNQTYICPDDDFMREKVCVHEKTPNKKLLKPILVQRYELHIVRAEVATASLQPKNEENFKYPAYGGLKVILYNGNTVLDEALLVRLPCITDRMYFFEKVSKFKFYARSLSNITRLEIESDLKGIKSLFPVETIMLRRDRTEWIFFRVYKTTFRKIITLDHVAANKRDPFKCQRVYKNWEQFTASYTYAYCNTIKKFVHKGQDALGICPRLCAPRPGNPWVDALLAENKKSNIGLVKSLPESDAVTDVCSQIPFALPMTCKLVEAGIHENEYR